MNAQPYQWSTDKSRMGLKLMAKMGWTEGNGLGAKEDGQVDNIKPQRCAEGGVGAPSAAENVWKSPGVMAEGLNDVLTRLSSIGEAPKEQPENEKKTKTKTKKKKIKGGRGFYERKRDRKNVGQYSKDQLREIFGGVDIWANNKDKSTDKNDSNTTSSKQDNKDDDLDRVNNEQKEEEDDGDMNNLKPVNFIKDESEPVNTSSTSKIEQSNETLSNEENAQMRKQKEEPTLTESKDEMNGFSRDDAPIPSVKVDNQTVKTEPETEVEGDDSSNDGKVEPAEIKVRDATECEADTSLAKGALKNARERKEKKKKKKKDNDSKIKVKKPIDKERNNEKPKDKKKKKKKKNKES